MKINNEEARKLSFSFHECLSQQFNDSVSGIIYDIDNSIKADAEKGFFDTQFTLAKNSFMSHVVRKNRLGLYVLTNEGQKVWSILQSCGFCVKKSWFTGTIYVNWKKSSS
jgi:hypothetical protein